MLECQIAFPGCSLCTYSPLPCLIPHGPRTGRAFWANAHNPCTDGCDAISVSPMIRGDAPAELVLDFVEKYLPSLGYKNRGGVPLPQVPIVSFSPEPPSPCRRRHAAVATPPSPHCRRHADVVTPLSLRRRRHTDVATPPSPRRRRHAAVAALPSSRRRRHAAVAAQSTSHRRRHAAAATPPPPRRRRHAAVATPLSLRRRRNTDVATPPPPRGVATPPSPRRRRRTAVVTLPSLFCLPSPPTWPLARFFGTQPASLACLIHLFMLSAYGCRSPRWCSHAFRLAVHGVCDVVEDLCCMRNGRAVFCLSRRSSAN
jgi:hypothetical protein